MTQTTPLIFITGASSGLGQAMAWRFYQAGWRLALVARRGDAIAQWAREKQLDTARYAIYPADVAVIDSIAGAGAACIAQQGLPDIVIANAGISIGMDSSQREDLTVMQEIYAINNIGMAATFHPFITPMRARGSGQLVGVASVAGIRGFPGHGAYNSSKAAAISYCESLRGEMRGSGVGVQTLLPGYVATALTSKNTYSMPFLMQADAFAERAYRSILAGNSYRVIPWQMGWVAKLLRLLPNAAFDRLAAGRGKKPRRGEL